MRFYAKIRAKYSLNVQIKAEKLDKWENIVYN